ncbi:unnamed protein product [Symbiodinium sp. CCMP2592]|nr:unnamed protein product [Symbiodinium sp. CCMP2592]
MPCSSSQLSGVIHDLILGSVSSSFGSLVNDFCESQGESTARGTSLRQDIFPLPLPRSSSVKEWREKEMSAELWYFNVVVALNYLHGGKHVSLECSTPTEVQQGILDYLRGRVDCFLTHEFRVDVFDWREFLRTRSLSYTGEEVKSACWTSWENIKPALPHGSVGSVSALDLAEGGVREFLINPQSFLRKGWDTQSMRSSRVMVSDSDWGDLARGLVQYNLCAILPESAILHCGGTPVFNGLFGVEKGEQAEGVEMNAFEIQPSEELLISSEDIRAMFYIFGLPSCWLPYFAFNKPVPEDLVPPGVDESCYLCSKVLPMGFISSVGVAQHIHRNFLRKVQGDPKALMPYAEIRRDRSLSLSNPRWRVYLDNLDLLHNVNPDLVGILEGEVSDHMASLITCYNQAGIPLNDKKSVKQKTFAEIQGAEIDGSLGVSRPKGEKLGKYASAAISLLRKKKCSRKEIQVVCGGLVYFCMFRRPLMSCLNYVWRFIQSFDDPGPLQRELPSAVVSELSMFLCLLPLAHQDFRSPISRYVTASDASMDGGGLCVSDGLTPYGLKVSSGAFRGENVDDIPERGVVCVGLFDGVGSLRLALEVLQVNVQLHVSVESDEHAKRVVEGHFNNVVQLNSVEDITPEMCQRWAGKASGAGMVIVGAGQCQGVNRPNGERSGSVSVIQPLIRMLRQSFSWCPVHFIQESVFQMDLGDRQEFTRAAGVLPIRICASELSPCRRDRLYWIDWTVEAGDGAHITPSTTTTRAGFHEVHFEVNRDFVGVFHPRWGMMPGVDCLATFTTSQPSEIQPTHAAGISKCSPDVLARWKDDRHRFPPYQYRDQNLLVHANATKRIPSVDERERCMGMPRNYTFNSLPKNQVKSQPQHHEDVRMSLVGNAWSVPVIAWLLLQLLNPLGLCLVKSLSGILDILFRDCPILSDSLLSWHSFDRGCCIRQSESELTLVRKLMTLISTKGDDVLIQPSGVVVVLFRNFGEVFLPLSGSGKWFAGGGGVTRIITTSTS